VWIKRVERWRDSGLSAKEFAEQAGVDSDRLRHGKWRLAKESVEPKAASVESAAISAPLAFVEVTPPPPRDRNDEEIEILDPSGFRIRVPERFDAETLRRVLAAMR
jgi:hypothetical protein